MSDAQEAIASSARLAKGFRDWFAAHLQILFAAGIATLGLVLNSPAVIIGAMLISPLMGPILGGGLALATGDFLLGLRAILNLALSSAVAVTLAVLLVGLLPFKEMTDEIASRTQPTTLDLVVALFSGAVGSIATCKQIKGVVTSIPGVAIAVALMPPLCVVGYGIGYAFSVNGSEGIRVARGGGLLFLTNLVAITFTAMIVFLALHIDTAPVRQRIEEWRATDGESAWFRAALKRLRVSSNLRSIGSLPGRLLMIGVPILVILIPLGQSFNQLKGEIMRKQEENHVRRAAVALWQQNFAKLPDGRQRSFMDQLSIVQQDGKVSLQLRVFTSKPFSREERNDYSRLLAANLNRLPDSMSMQLVEIPTTSEDLVAKAREERRVDTPPSFAQLQANFAQGLDSGLTGLRLPSPAEMIDYHATTSPAEPILIDIGYLSERDIEPDARALIVEDVRTRLNYPTAKVSLTRVENSFGPLLFRRNRTGLILVDSTLLDRTGDALKRHPTLRLVITAPAENVERAGPPDEQVTAVKDYLVSKCATPESRIEVGSAAAPARGVMLRLKVSGGLQ
jgi:uncharacterized hydrophobic protein (TIGR00271 family)